MSEASATTDDIRLWPVRDDVRRLDLATYEQSMQAAVDAFNGVTGVVAMYQLGSVKFPGISDLDLIIVVDDGIAPGTDFQAVVRDAAGPDGAYVFSHPPYVVDEQTFRGLSALFFADNLQLRWGRPISLAGLEPDEQAFCAFQIAVEAAIGQSFAFLRALHNRSLPNLRSLLCHLNAVRHNFTTLERFSGGPRAAHHLAYAARIDRLRGAWFELDAEPRLTEACALLVQARDLLCEILGDLGRVGVARAWVLPGKGAATLSLLDVGLLLRFGPGEVANDALLRNPLAGLRSVPGLGAWLALQPRWREIVADVSVLQLPAALYPLVDCWSAVSGPVSDVLASRRLAGKQPGAQLSAAAAAWAARRSVLVNGHFQFLRERQLGGFLPLTPASWLQRPTTLANRAKTAWHAGWTARHRSAD